MLKLAALAAALSFAALAPAASAEPLKAGDRYVAMGSSYAAGPGVGKFVPGTPNRCGRSSQSYSRVLAARLNLDLVDASCGGAVTANLLAPWKELPAQIDAVTPETRLVTVTVGGNDVRFVGLLGMGTCPFMNQPGRPASACPPVRPPSEAEWTTLETNMNRLAHDLRARAPRATVVFVDYVSIVPERGTCVALGVSEDVAEIGRQAARRLAAITRKAALSNGARILEASKLTRGHDACAADPWSLGARMRAGGVPMHPAIPAHAAIAQALEKMLAHKPRRR